MLAKLGLRSMSFLERTRIEARFPEAIFLMRRRKRGRESMYPIVDDF